MKQVTFELDSERPVKPSSLTIEKQKVIVLLETSLSLASAEGEASFGSSLEISTYSKTRSFTLILCCMPLDAFSWAYFPGRVLLQLERAVRNGNYELTESMIICKASI